MTDMNAVVGPYDILFVTLDTLRFDVAAEELAAGGTPHLARVLPGPAWERRHTPATFTYAAHHAFFAGFLPTPDGPGPHPRLFAAAFAGSESTAAGTFVFDEPDLPGGLAGRGYHTVCVGGVGFFNRRTALGRVLPDLFAASHWAPECGVTDPDSTRHQVDAVIRLLSAAPPGPVFTFLNVSAIHQPNRHYRPGAEADGRDTHAAALRYVDTQLPRLFAAVTGRGRPCFTVICADHGTAYGEDGHRGHRVAHESVWTVPYAELVLRPGEW